MDSTVRPRSRRCDRITGIEGSNPSASRYLPAVSRNGTTTGPPWASSNAGELRCGAGCQGGWLLKDVDAEGGFVAGSVDVGASGVVLGDGSFDDAGCHAGAPVGQEVVQHVAADGADQVDGGGGEHAGGLDELVASGL